MNTKLQTVLFFLFLQFICALNTRKTKRFGINCHSICPSGFRDDGCSVEGLNMEEVRDSHGNSQMD